MSHGFVYVLGNESMPGIYKIGFTLKHPRCRMDDLSRATACPTPFELLAFIGHEEAQWAEGEIHKNLGQYRVNDAREFFKVDPDIIQDQLRQHGDPCMDAFYDSALQGEIYLYARQARRRWLVDHFFSQSADPIEWPKYRGFE